MKYGINLPASQIASYLERSDKQREGVKTWSQFLGGASLGFGSQESAITSAYADEMRAAYEQSFRQQDLLQGAGLSYGSTQRALGMSQQELARTYDTFVRNYSQDLQSASQRYGEEVGGIYSDLGGRAENFSQMLESAYKYLSEELHGSVRYTDDLTRPILGGKKGKEDTGQYEQIEHSYLSDMGLDWLLTDDGAKPTYTEEGVEIPPELRLLSWGEIKNVLFDERYELTEEGVRFFDQMFNARPEGFMTDDKSTRAFDEWLSETNPELREWWAGADEYNYTFQGGHAGTLSAMLGRSSMDFDPSVPPQKAQGFTTEFASTVDEKLGDKTIRSINENVPESLPGQRTYEDWFDTIEKELAGETQLTQYSHEVHRDFVNAVDSYISDYQNIMIGEVSAFQEELMSILGNNMTEEFWDKYGKEIDDTLSRIETIAYKNKGPEDFTDTKGTEKYLKNKLRDIKKLQGIDFADIKTNLYDNLQKYLTEKQLEFQEAGGEGKYHTGY